MVAKVRIDPHLDAERGVLFKIGRRKQVTGLDVLGHGTLDLAVGIGVRRIQRSVRTVQFRSIEARQYGVVQPAGLRVAVGVLQIAFRITNF